MTRPIQFVLATVFTISLTALACGQTANSGGKAATGTGNGATAGAGQAANTGASAGPSQSGSAGNSGAGPNQTGSTGTSAGPNQTGGAGQLRGTSPTGAPGNQGNAGQPGQPMQNGQPQAGRAPGQVGVGVPTNQISGSFVGIPRTPWFNNTNARFQLQLNDPRFNQLNQAYGNAWTQYKQGMTGLRNNLNRDERLQQMRTLRQGFDTDFGRVLDTTFSDRALRERFTQLNLQFQGFAAFEDPAVQQRLNLTPEQRLQFERLAQNWNEQMQQLSQTNPNDRAASTQRFNELRDQIAQQINSILTPDQRRTWAQLVGTPFAFEWNDYFPPDSGPWVDRRLFNQNGAQQPPAQRPSQPPTQQPTQQVPTNQSPNPLANPPATPNR